MPRKRFPVTTMVASPVQLQEARDWIADCEWGEEYTPDDIARLTATQIIIGVNRHYEGGWAGFCEDISALHS